MIYSSDQLSLESVFCYFSVIRSTRVFWRIRRSIHILKWQTVALYTITRITRIVILQFKVFSTLPDAMILCNQAAKYVIAWCLINDLPYFDLTWNVMELSYRENVRYFTSFLTSINADMCSRFLISCTYENFPWGPFYGCLSVYIDELFDHFIWLIIINVFKLIWFKKIHFLIQAPLYNLTIFSFEFNLYISWHWFIFIILIYNLLFYYSFSWLFRASFSRLLYHFNWLFLH